MGTAGQRRSEQQDITQRAWCVPSTRAARDASRGGEGDARSQRRPAVEWEPGGEVPSRSGAAAAPHPRAALYDIDWYYTEQVQCRAGERPDRPRVGRVQNRLVRPCSPPRPPATSPPPGTPAPRAGPPASCVGKTDTAVRGQIPPPARHTPEGTGRGWRGLAARHEGNDGACQTNSIARPKQLTRGVGLWVGLAWLGWRTAEDPAGWVLKRLPR